MLATHAIRTTHLHIYMYIFKLQQQQSVRTKYTYYFGTWNEERVK